MSFRNARSLLSIWLENYCCRAMVAHAFNPSTWEAEVGRFLSSRHACTTEWVPRQPGLYRETLSWKAKNKKRKKKEIKIWQGKKSHMLSPQSYIHPCRMHSPCRAMAEIQLPRTPSSQMSSCFLPTLSVAKGYRFHTEHLLASSLSCFESGPSRSHRESNLCKKAGSVSSLTSGLIVAFYCVYTASFLCGS